MGNRPLDHAGSIASRRALPAVPSSIPAIRHELDRVLDSLQFPHERAADTRLALTEACTNAVQHAYADGAPAGEMIVTFRESSAALILSVADAGRGTAEPSPQPGLGVGLRVIHSLADTVTIENLRPGTEIRMTFQRRPSAKRRDSPTEATHPGG
jgi:anti-sigma regulatory factor (Ser/Thr protein kinase)